MIKFGLHIIQIIVKVLFLKLYSKVWMDGFVSLRRHHFTSNLLKAFQTNAERLFGFFNAHLLSRASS